MHALEVSGSAGEDSLAFLPPRSALRTGVVVAPHKLTLALGALQARGPRWCCCMDRPSRQPPGSRAGHWTLWRRRGCGPLLSICQVGAPQAWPMRVLCNPKPGAPAGCQSAALSCLPRTRRGSGVHTRLAPCAGLCTRAPARGPALRCRPAGHGVTGGAPLPLEARPAFLAALLARLQPAPPLVVVTPSMSGSYFLPWLTRHAEQLAGWVAVAPAGLRQWVEAGTPPAGSQAQASDGSWGRAGMCRVCSRGACAAAECGLLLDVAEARFRLAGHPTRWSGLRPASTTQAWQAAPGGHGPHPRAGAPNTPVSSACSPTPV